MHQVDGTGVGINVRLDACLLCLVPVTAAATIKKTEEKAHGKVAESLQEREKCVEVHSSADGVSNGAEPRAIKVGELSMREPKVKGLLVPVGTNEKQEDGRVEELHNESDSGRLGQALGLCRKADPVNKSDTDRSQDEIDNGQHV